MKEGDCIEISDWQIIASSSSFSDCIQTVFSHAANISSCNVIKVFYGKECLEAAKEELRKIFKDVGVVDLAEFEGNQPVYNLIISFE